MNDYRPITSIQFIKWLQEHGVVPMGTYRVQIDADEYEPVKVRADYYAQKNLIEDAPPEGLREE